MINLYSGADFKIFIAVSNHLAKFIQHLLCARFGITLGS